jgi:hypothetical protein
MEKGSSQSQDENGSSNQNACAKVFSKASQVFGIGERRCDTCRNGRRLRGSKNWWYGTEKETTATAAAAAVDRETATSIQCHLCGTFDIEFIVFGWGTTRNNSWWGLSLGTFGCPLCQTATTIAIGRSQDESISRATWVFHLFPHIPNRTCVCDELVFYRITSSRKIHGFQTDD